MEQKNLLRNSQNLRKNMTKEERHLWYDFLKTLPVTVNRQKVIGRYIADFYIASEAGITNLLGDWIDINSAVIESREGLQSVGTSQGFPIPEKYVDETSIL